LASEKGSQKDVELIQENKSEGRTSRPVSKIVSEKGSLKEISNEVNDKESWSRPVSKPTSEQGSQKGIDEPIVIEVTSSSRPVSKLASERATSEKAYSHNDVSHKAVSEKAVSHNDVSHKAISEKAVSEKNVSEKGSQKSVPVVSDDFVERDSGEVVQHTEEARDKPIYEYEEHHTNKHPETEPNIEAGVDKSVEINVRSSINVARSAEEIDEIRSATKSFIAEVLTKPVERGKY
jgi:hypothetical protein